MTLPYQGNWPGHSLKRTVSIIMSTAEAFILLVNYVTLEPYLRQSSWGRQHWILNRCLPVLRELKVYQKTCSGDIWTTLLTAGFRLKGVYYPEGIGQLSLIWLVLCCVCNQQLGWKKSWFVFRCTTSWEAETDVLNHCQTLLLHRQLMWVLGALDLGAWYMSR